MPIQPVIGRESGTRRSREKPKEEQPNHWRKKAFEKRLFRGTLEHPEEENRVEMKNAHISAGKPKYLRAGGKKLRCNL